MIRILCGTANALLGIVMIALCFAVPGAGKAVPIQELLFYGLAALLFLAVSSGLFFRTRWMIVVAGLALFLAAVLFSLMVAAGGEIRGPGNAGTTGLLAAGGIAVALVELVALIAARRIRKPRPAP